MPLKSWSEMSGKQKVAIIVLSLTQLGLMIAALRDIRRRDDDEIKGSKRMWMVLTMVDFIGPLAYFKFGRR